MIANTYSTKNRSNMMLLKAGIELSNVPTITWRFFKKLMVLRTRSARTARIARNTRNSRRIFGLSVDKLWMVNCSHSRKLASTMKKSAKQCGDQSRVATSKCQDSRDLANSLRT